MLSNMQGMQGLDEAKKMLEQTNPEMARALGSLQSGASANKSAAPARRQTKEEKAVMMHLLDHLFYEENIIMVNTGTCMFSTALGKAEVDQLTEAMYNAFRAVRDELLPVYEKYHGS